ncbi:MAG: hypothetical protein QM831_23415 [Kofleriaceae bacterium]
MERSELAFVHARRAYERAHISSAARGIALAAVFVVLAVGLHHTSQFTWIVAGCLAITLATLGFRGGAARRGALAGVLAGLPVFIAPTIVFSIAHGGMQCPNCELGPTAACLVTCLTTSLLAGAALGYSTRSQPLRFVAGAIASALFVGLLGCATTGISGAVGIVVGVLAGSATVRFVHA